jgi:hypothetical protein
VTMAELRSIVERNPATVGGVHAGRRPAHPAPGPFALAPPSLLRFRGTADVGIGN